MTTLAIGRVRPVLKGDWIATLTYEAMSLVRYEGQVYQAVQDVPVNAVPSTPNSVYWYLIGQKGNDGARGADGAPGPQGSVGPDSIPIGFPAWWHAIVPPNGWLDKSRDMGQLPRALYPQLWEFALGSGNLLDDTTWSAQVATQGTCGAFSSGNGVDTFRIPLERAVYPRAADPSSGLVVGQFQNDTMRPITGGVNVNRLYVSTLTGAFYDAGYRGIPPTDSSGTTISGFGINSGLLGAAYNGNEVRPKTIIYLPIIKAFDTVVNTSIIEVGGLVTQIGTVADRLATSQQVLHVQDRKTNVAGGTATSGAWRTRDLNTVLKNTIPGASLANNQFTLPAGTYHIKASAPACSVNAHTITIYNVSIPNYTVGTDEYASATSSVVNRCFIDVVLTVDASTTYELRHVVQTTRATDGFGVCAYAVSAAPSVYSDVFIRRLV